MRQQGATLIQMMCALAMVGLLTQLGLPSYAALSQDLQRAAVARDLLHTLRTARSHAMLQQHAVLVQPIDQDWGLGWRMLQANTGRLLREQRLGGGVQIVGNLPEGVRFSVQGVTMRSATVWRGGTLEICAHSAGAQRRQVILAPSGRVRLSTSMAAKPLCPGH